ncbi:DUF411 domain-containing protein [Roseivivax marinus]|uniref:DUF411 domain-containing protein n=1 Tax=Roseivivax marinus TaxID=1379903 RepID=UPI00273FC7EE|nr:DUF411 domain-containing protein [Roseivivax marinus]
MHRRTLIAAALAVPFAGLARAQGADAPAITVFKDPNCGCCSGWVAHMRDAGFDVEARDVAPDALQAVKVEAGVAPDMASCHTALVGDYVVEGHVPAEDVRRLLDERPEALGLAVPGMPVGSPGMEMGGRVDPYEVKLLTASGTETFARHG